jgi:DNA-binding transcriptional ArsR family regulator
MEARRDIFQAIADPTRRAILSLLAIQAMTPGAISENFDSSRQTISKHIQILTECQLVNQEQKGREIHYHINVDKINEIDIWVQQFKKILETQFAQLDEVLFTLKKQKNEK